MTCRLRPSDGAVISGEMTRVPFRGILGPIFPKSARVGVIKNPVKDTSRILNSGILETLTPDFPESPAASTKKASRSPALARDGWWDGLMEPAIR